MRPTPARLVAKAYDGSTKLAILHAKHLAGYHEGSFVQAAEQLAQFGLRGTLIAELTGLPVNAAKRIVQGLGNFKTGRRKTSIDDIFQTTETQQRVSLFLVNVEKLLNLDRAPAILSGHILDAIRATYAQAPDQLRTADWERMAEAALQFQSGALLLITCAACRTRHVIPARGNNELSLKVNESDRSCPLCRIAESVTSVKRVIKDDREISIKTTVRLTDKTVIPSVTSDLYERKQRLRALADADLRDTKVAVG